jgi:hypothetical protein
MPLAISGQPAKRATASRTRENTSPVDESREASTIEADRADVSDSEDVKLIVSWADV